MFLQKHFLKKKNEEYEEDIKLWFFEHGGILPEETETVPYQDVKLLVKAWNRKQKRASDEYKKARMKNKRALK